MTDVEIIGLLQESVRKLDRNNMEAFRAIMKQTETELAQRGENDKLRGEVLLLSVIGGLVEPEHMVSALARAEQLIGGPSRVLVPELQHVENHFNAYMLWGSVPGVADEFAQKGHIYEDAAAIFQRLCGAGYGIGACYQAQLAYYRGDFERAYAFAKVALEGNASASRLPSLIKVYMMEVLAGVGKHTMNQKLWRSSYGYLHDVASARISAGRACVEQAGIICTMQDMALGCLHDVPSWLRTGDFGAIPVEWGYEMTRDNLLTGSLLSAMVAHVEYLAFNSEPIHALNTAETMRHVYGIGSVPLDAYLDLLRAGCYYQLEKPNHARRALEAAMKCIVPDGLWLIAAEFENGYGEELYSIAREFDPDAPEKIRLIGDGYMDKLAPLRNELLRGTSEALTKREQEIANLVMKGYSNSEIAASLNVTVRTVRFHLENVYAKLNITGRSKLLNSMEQKGVPKLANWVK